MTRDYFVDFACDFDLHDYPVDTQVCYIKIEVHRGAGNMNVTLKPDGVGITFEGNFKSQKKIGKSVHHVLFES